ncbi:integrator complex subunit 10 [Caerostris darwini]|uniref:Integrator complex subunit 10 n=1 Tax=Caerostris darwini TaxID=1538125 RepID=A0AAV4NPT4_9ARAC|nr:integrator complex subunit 10 [Caerostris darwini]
MASNSEEKLSMNTEEWTRERDEEDKEAFLLSKLQNSSGGVNSQIWTIFASSFFPRNSTILYESYQRAYARNDLEESSKYLRQLIEISIETVNQEVKIIAETLCSESNSFMRKIFELLPENAKYKVMLNATQNITSLNCFEYCELMLAFLKQIPFPKYVKHAYDVNETLILDEKNCDINDPINRSRMISVCQVFPLIIQMSQVDMRNERDFYFLQQAVEFYLSCMFIPPTAQNDEIIKSLHLCRTVPLERWGPLLELFKAFAIRYKWTIPEKLEVYNENRVDELVVWLKFRGNDFHNMILKKYTKLEVKQQCEEVFFSICLAFFYYFYEIASYIYPQNKPNFFQGKCTYFLLDGNPTCRKKCPENLGNELLLAEISDRRKGASVFLTPQSENIGPELQPTKQGDLRKGALIFLTPQRENIGPELQPTNQGYASNLRKGASVFQTPQLGNIGPKLQPTNQGYASDLTIGASVFQTPQRGNIGPQLQPTNQGYASDLRKGALVFLTPQRENIGPELQPTNQGYASDLRKGALVFLTPQRENIGPELQPTNQGYASDLRKGALVFLTPQRENIGPELQPTNQGHASDLRKGALVFLTPQRENIGPELQSTNQGYASNLRKGASVFQTPQLGNIGPQLQPTNQGYASDLRKGALVFLTPQRENIGPELQSTNQGYASEIPILFQEYN